MKNSIPKELLYRKFEEQKHHKITRTEIIYENNTNIIPDLEEKKIDLQTQTKMEVEYKM